MAKNNKSNATAEVVRVTNSDNGFQVVDLKSSIPSLDKAAIAPIDLMSDYWTPARAGEKKRVFFVRIAPRKVIDQQDPNKVIELDCAYFLENADGEVRSISNGSKRLVGALESINAQNGMPFEITYLGKKRNRSNSFSSDDWSIKPLLLQATVVNGEGAE